MLNEIQQQQKKTKRKIIMKTAYSRVHMYVRSLKLISMKKEKKKEKSEKRNIKLCY